MAFVPITAATVTLQGRSGAIYQLAFTKATAVGMCTFTQDAQTFYAVPEDCRIVDMYIGDTVNKTDYIDPYVDSVQKIQQRVYVYNAYANTTVPRIPPSSWIRKGSQFAMYFYSA